MRRKFELGKLRATDGAVDAIDTAKVLMSDYLFRHMSGDWGNVDDHDRNVNDEAVEHGGRILSEYLLPTNVKLWIITEEDRSITTFLLPSEY